MESDGLVIVRVRGTRTQVIAPYLDAWRVEAHRLGGKYRARGKFWSFHRNLPVKDILDTLRQLYHPALIDDQTRGDWREVAS
jgi:acetone carboxylase gamma subunit